MLPNHYGTFSKNYKRAEYGRANKEKLNSNPWAQQRLITLGHHSGMQKQKKLLTLCAKWLPTQSNYKFPICKENIREKTHSICG